MKKNIFYISVLLLSSSVYGQSYLKLIKFDNSVQSFDLMTSEIRFSNTEDILIKEGASNTLQFAFNNVNELRFETSSTFIPSIISESLILFQKDNFLFISGVNNSKLQKTAIYNSLGQCMFTKTQLPTDPINISSLNSGVYILVLDKNKALKFIK